MNCRIVITYQMILAIFFPVNGFAHFDHFHSLDELSSHVNAHIARLECVLASGTLDRKIVKKECRDILDHAYQYQQLAENLIRGRDNIETARFIDFITGKLIDASRGDRIFVSLGLLRKIQGLIHMENTLGIVRGSIYCNGWVCLLP